MFKEVELVMACKRMNKDVEEAVESYNNAHAQRKPIQLLRL